MAGDWTPIRTNLRKDPAVFALSARLKITTFDVVGRLHEFWSWAQDHSEDGELNRVGPELVDAVVELSGFAEALVSVGWLTFSDTGCTVPGFATWMGQGAKARLKDAKRKRDERAKSVPTVPRKPLSEKRPSSVQENPDTIRTTGQERRVNNPQVPTEPIPPSRGDSPEPPKAKRKRAKPFDWRTILAEPEFASLAADPQFVAAWEGRVAARAESKHAALGPTGTRTQFRAALEYGIPSMLEAIKVANGNGSQGIFPRHASQTASAARQSAPELMSAAEAVRRSRARRAQREASEGPRDVRAEFPFQLLGGL